MPWETLPGGIAPDNTAPRVTWAHKPLHHIKVAFHWMRFTDTSSTMEVEVVFLTYDLLYIIDRKSVV